MGEANELRLAQETFNGKLYIREWQPGDGLRCSVGKKTTRVPCGPPVAVTLQVNSYRWRPNEDRYQRVVCALHLPGVTSAGEISADADKAARERLLVEHWEDYQRYVDEEVARRVEETIEFASEELRRLALGEHEEASR
ncbi:hypothetical protein ACIBQ6_21930 [Nonomuraea sp. NPDC049655]|uniref:hypothetical protein n=1 Tax=Nonomuraea sp. NPDC049655 TaxID=3364355 RepID=UPI0037A070A5